jgi:hypothetical protein
MAFIAAECERCLSNQIPARWSQARSARTAGAKPSRSRIEALRRPGQANGSRECAPDDRLRVSRDPALGARHSPRPHFLGEEFTHYSGASRRGNAEVCLRRRYEERDGVLDAAGYDD